MLQQNLHNGCTKNDHCYFNANHLIIKQLTNVKTLIDVEFNFKSIGIFEFIEQLIIKFLWSVLGCNREWSIDPVKTSLVVGGSFLAIFIFFKKSYTKMLVSFLKVNWIVFF